jgi:hypothetical protein
MRHGEYNMKTDNNEMHNLDYAKCLCGKVINVVIWEAGHWNSIYKQEDGARNYFNVGKFVRIRNAIAKIDGAVACKFSCMTLHYFNALLLSYHH